MKRFCYTISMEKELISGLTADQLQGIVTSIIDDRKGEVCDATPGEWQLHYVIYIIAGAMLMNYPTLWSDVGFLADLEVDRLIDYNLKRVFPDGRTEEVADANVRMLCEEYKKRALLGLIPYLRPETIELGKRIFPEYAFAWDTWSYDCMKNEASVTPRLKRAYTDK